jgi:urease accessory protein
MYEKHNFSNSNDNTVLVIVSVNGNIFSDKRMSEKYRRAKASGKCEFLFVSRMEMERLRLRRRTDKGTDIGLVLDPGNRLNHGDVLTAKERFIVVEQKAEWVVSISLRKIEAKKMVSIAAIIGHTIGNRHKPIAIDNGTISFPAQSEEEVDTFRKLLPSDIELKMTEQVFTPVVEAHVHE